MHDEHDDEPELKRFEPAAISPLERFRDPEGWRQRRMEQLREVIEGPSTPEDNLRAQHEYFDLRRGYSHDDDEYGF